MYVDKVPMDICDVHKMLVVREVTYQVPKWLSNIQNVY